MNHDKPSKGHSKHADMNTQEIKEHSLNIGIKQLCLYSQNILLAV